MLGKGYARKRICSEKDMLGKGYARKRGCSETVMFLEP